jgi:O-antigen/teichoic acid export membrane protein
MTPEALLTSREVTTAAVEAQAGTEVEAPVRLLPEGSPATRRRRLDPLGATSAALMANTAVTSVLGMAFWAAASRRYPARQLGDDAALISAMMLLSVISQLNLAMGISRLLPQVHARRWRPIAAAYGVTAAVAVALTAGFVAVAPRVSDGFGALSDHPQLAVALIVAVVLWNVFALQDAVLTAARWAVALPIENGLFGVLKIGLMVVLVSHVAGHGIFIAWLVAMAVMLVPVNLLLFGRVLPAGARPDVPAPLTVLPLDDRSRITRYLAVDYVAALLSQGYTSVLPLLVVAVLGQADNAYFYIAFVIAGAVRAVSQSMSTSLVVEGAHQESELAALTRLSVRRYVRLAVPGTLLLVAGAGLLLRPFGPDYVSRGTTLLQLLLLATIPQAAVTLYLGVERVRARVRRVLAAEAATGLLVAVGATVGMRVSGLTGVGVGWLAAQTIVAVVVLPHLWRVGRQVGEERTHGGAG